ncbi:MAG: SOS response-associated peptidase [Candidatus Aureabacteria bacterium]|nr:SOS response-associated peptidase [Candidatus Auribacterota bacterium]
MCGRFVRKTTASEAAKSIPGSVVLADSQLSFNIAPGVLVSVLEKEKELRWTLHHWGIQPRWEKNGSSNQIINIRCETLSDRSFFDEDLKHRRCLLLADGFYEWKKTGARSEPYYFFLKDSRPFFFAGIWNSISQPYEDVIHACAIITVPANPLVGRIHTRMPAILSLEEGSDWIRNSSMIKSELCRFLKPCPDDRMSSHRVSQWMNFQKHDTEECIKPVGDEPEKELNLL